MGRYKENPETPKARRSSGNENSASKGIHRPVCARKRGVGRIKGVWHFPPPNSGKRNGDLVAGDSQMREVRTMARGETRVRPGKNEIAVLREVRDRVRPKEISGGVPTARGICL